ncbi:MAG: hypothetical protein QOK40_545 [Miltoncostaeaceae bacterium]|nr:hypothetical protein [Miltoncostaeaceae bacterium]
MNLKSSPLRGVALLPAGAFVVHQLRLLLEFGSGEAGESAAHGHLYIGSLLPWVMLAVAAALGGLLTHIAGDWRRAAVAKTHSGPSILSLWLTASASLVALHALQEALEGLLLGGPGLIGLFAIGGLWALAAAVAVGGLIALALRGARVLVVRVARARRAQPGHPAAAARMPRPRSAGRLLVAPLARQAAGRAPPLRPRLAA